MTRWMPPTLALLLAVLLAVPAAAPAQPASAAPAILGVRPAMPAGDPAADPFAGVYAALPAGERSQFDSLLSMTVVPPSPAPDSPFRRPDAPAPAATPRKLTAAEQQLLKALLVDRTLVLRASDGATVLSHLAALAACAPADPRSTMSGTSLALDLIRMLAAEDLSAAMRATDALDARARAAGQATRDGHPLPGGVGEITQNAVHFTCGAASAQVWMRLNQPAELVRIAHGLFCDGTVNLHDTRLEPARNSQQYHAGDRIFSSESFRGDEGTEDRCDLDILLQSALMDKIALGNLSAYDVHADSGGLANVVNGNSGSHPMYLEREMQRLTGRTWAYQHNLNPGRLGWFGRFFGNLRARTDQTALVELLLAQCRAGKQLVICFQTRPGDAMALHYVTVVGFSDATKTVYYTDTCEDKAARSKMYTLTRDELVEKLRAVIHPQ